MKKPRSFATPNFKMRVNKWPFFRGHLLMRGLGDEGIRLVQARIGKGRQSTGEPLPPYGGNYGRDRKLAGAGGRRNLSLSGSLVSSLRTLSQSKNTVTIGWGKGTSSPKVILGDGWMIRGRGSEKHRSIVQRLTRGTRYVQPRAILGITKSDKAKLRKWLKKRRKALWIKK